MTCTSTNSKNLAKRPISFAAAAQRKILAIVRVNHCLHKKSTDRYDRFHYDEQASTAILNQQLCDDGAGRKKTHERHAIAKGRRLARARGRSQSKGPMNYCYGALQQRCWSSSDIRGRSSVAFAGRSVKC